MKTSCLLTGAPPPEVTVQHPAQRDATMSRDERGREGHQDRRPAYLNQRLAKDLPTNAGLNALQCYPGSVDINDLILFNRMFEAHAQSVPASVAR
jgi:hypothetical protein